MRTSGEDGPDWYPMMGGDTADGTTVRFLDVLGAMEERSGRQLGTRKVERLGG